MVTGLILGLSLPATAPWYVGCIGAIVAMGIGKMVFGGVGMNIFNPAMVGRAFVMISFAGSLGASGYVDPSGHVDILSQATPLTAYKLSDVSTSLTSLFWGNTNGSLGETSVPACLLGGLYLCVRRVASWEIPAGMIAACCGRGRYRQPDQSGRFLDRAAPCHGRGAAFRGLFHCHRSGDQPLDAQRANGSSVSASACWS